jgi:hypothetical protein
MNTIKPPIYTYEWCFNGDWYSMTVHCKGKPPNRFRRAMLRLLLGVHTRLRATR